MSPFDLPAASPIVVIIIVVGRSYCANGAEYNCGKTNHGQARRLKSPLLIRTGPAATGAVSVELI